MWKLFGSIICLLFIVVTSGWTQEVETEYFALYFNGDRCGYGLQKRQVEDNRVISSDSMYLEIKRMGTVIKLTTKETTFETLAGKPISFLVEQGMATMKMSVKGTIGPDNIMEIITENAGNVQKSKVPYPEGAVMTEGLRLINKKHGLEPGTNYSAKAFVPSAMQALKMTFNIGQTEEIDLLGRVVELTEITGNYSMPGAGDISYRAYVDQDYKAQKMIMPVAGMEIEMVACSEEFAKSGIEAAEMVSAMVLKSPESIQDIKEVKEITYILSPKDPDTQLHIPVTDNQQVEILANNKIRLTIKPAKADPHVEFPYRGGDPAIMNALDSTTYLQASHPEIVALARQVVSDKKYAMEGAKAIEAFVAGYINNKDLSVGYASALEVVKSRQGDCTEHAVLTAALCRAVGIPAQVVMGVAYVNDFLGTMSCFGGHAWNQVYIGNQWIGIDAAFKGTGRGGYDAGHISLAVGNGEPHDFFNLLGSLGLFTIERIEIVH
jgi:hypothetical protein